MLVTCVGEILKYYLPFPIPASIYGLCIMMVLLVSKGIKIDEVKETGIFLVEIMPLMFIPAAAGLIVSWVQVKEMLTAVLVITIVSTFLVMTVAGKVTQFLLVKESKNV